MATQYRMIIRNEDVVPVFTTVHSDRATARALAEHWLLGATDAQRRSMGTMDSDDGWLQTMFDNGFYSIAEYRE